MSSSYGSIYRGASVTLLHGDHTSYIVSADLMASLDYSMGSIYTQQLFNTSVGILERKNTADRFGPYSMGSVYVQLLHDTLSMHTLRMDAAAPCNPQ